MLLLPSDFLEEGSREGREGSGSVIVPLKYIEYGVYGDLIITYQKPYSIYLKGDCKFSFEEKRETGTSDIGEKEGSHAD